MAPPKEIVDWLLEGDASIRWQVLRDLNGADPDTVQKERALTATTGWGAQFAARLLPDLTWPAGRWTGLPWVLLQIMDCGIPPNSEPFSAAALAFLDKGLSDPKLQSELGFRKGLDLCHVGFWLRIGSYFHPTEPKLKTLFETLRSTQMPDGGWNCRIRTTTGVRHSSFHTTFNVLEGLREAAHAEIIEPGKFRELESRALEFMLAHRLFKSDRTGEVVDCKFTYLTYPSHWHYTILRGLDYVRTTPEVADSRLQDALDHLQSQRAINGTWKVEKPIAGTSLFEMEKNGRPSRWNTLRALRVLAAIDPTVQGIGSTH